jgi:CheY-like chemotaxis protein
MGAKRALIVDDSRSARLFLARMLERYEIDVDNAESAESAIEYLASHRPDVIFMDHLMPGMDGFQAVQAIKNNPRTATIPIMMYTSQEGELYLGQARALGAVGVLPKQIKPTDVSKVLYQLHLVPDRRTGEQTTFRAIAAPESPLEAVVSADASVAPRSLTDSALREQFAELRRAWVAGIDTQTDRITAEVRALLQEAVAASASQQHPRQSARPWGWIAATLSLVLAGVSTLAWWHEASLRRELFSEMAQLRTAVAERAPPPVLAASPAVLPSAPAPGSSAGPAGAAAPTAITVPAALETVGETAALTSASGAQPGGVPSRRPLTSADSKPLVIAVPYGAEALGGPRLEIVRQLLERLAHQGASGIVEIRTYPGRFCLMGNSADGYSVAPEETAFSKCDVVGNPVEEAGPAQRVPLTFADLVGTIRSSTHGALDVQVTSGDVAATVSPYPAASNDLTAGEWNRAASANNRIEIRLH